MIIAREKANHNGAEPMMPKEDKKMSKRRFNVDRVIFYPTSFVLA